MKINKIIPLVVALILSTAAEANNDFKQAFNGMWQQDCGKHGNSVMTFNGVDTLLVDRNGVTRRGNWAVKRGTLHLKYDDQRRKERWKIIAIASDEYFIQRGDIHCVGRNKFAG